MTLARLRAKAGLSVSEILRNDFYIGTFRQAKYKRRKINGSDFKMDESEHIVFENHHEPIVDYRLFCTVQRQLENRTSGHYRRIKKYDNVYSGFLFCGDCGAPMFFTSNPKRDPEYTCGSYHRRGLQGCTSHHTKCSVLDEALKAYIRMVRDNSKEMISRLDEALILIHDLRCKHLRGKTAPLAASTLLGVHTVRRRRVSLR